MNISERKVNPKKKREREKGKPKFETFLCSYHGLTFQPDDFKLVRGAHG